MDDKDNPQLASHSSSFYVSNPWQNSQLSQPGHQSFLDSNISWTFRAEYVRYILCFCSAKHNSKHSPWKPHRWKCSVKIELKLIALHLFWIFAPKPCPSLTFSILNFNYDFNFKCSSVKIKWNSYLTQINNIYTRCDVILM